MRNEKRRQLYRHAKKRWVWWALKESGIQLPEPVLSVPFWFAFHGENSLFVGNVGYMINQVLPGWCRIKEVNGVVGWEPETDKIIRGPRTCVSDFLSIICVHAHKRSTKLLFVCGSHIWCGSEAEMCACPIGGTSLMGCSVPTPTPKLFTWWSKNLTSDTLQSFGSLLVPHAARIPFSFTADPESHAFRTTLSTMA